MKSLSFYEQVGILIPGAICLFACLLIVPGLKSVLVTANGISVGGLGVFLILAYAAGHAVAALGNLFEAAFWRCFGGMPSNWVVKETPGILQPEQVKVLETRIAERLGFTPPTLRGLPTKRWAGVFGQLYRDVLSTNPDRIETFNGNYGLNRGLTISFLVVAVLIAVEQPSKWGWLLVGALAMASVFTARMYRFGVNFAREVFLCFINPLPTPSTKKSD